MHLRFVLASAIALMGAIVAISGCFPSSNSCQDWYDRQRDCGVPIKSKYAQPDNCFAPDCASCLSDQPCEAIASDAAYKFCGCKQ